MGISPYVVIALAIAVWTAVSLLTWPRRKALLGPTRCTLPAPGLPSPSGGGWLLFGILLLAAVTGNLRRATDWPVAMLLLVLLLRTAVTALLFERADTEITDAGVRRFPDALRWDDIAFYDLTGRTLRLVSRRLALGTLRYRHETEIPDELRAAVEEIVGRHVVPYNNGAIV